MRKPLCIFILLCSLLALFGCTNAQSTAQIAATTLPVYEFTSILCDGTNIQVKQLITEEVSCLHDYTLRTEQMRTAEGAQLIVISGGGLEDFLGNITDGKQLIDASTNIDLHCGHDHDHEGHHHENDPHYWLSPKNAMVMVENISAQLTEIYPEHTKTFAQNKEMLLAKLTQLDENAQKSLQDLQCKDLITFHDGFGYLAEAYDLHILKAIEEESGSEASAAELIEIINLVKEHHMTAIFIERNGSSSAADIIARETGAKIYILDMAMGGQSYFDAMNHNIDTLKEALG